MTNKETPSFETITGKAFSSFERTAFLHDITSIKLIVQKNGLSLKTLVDSIIEHANFRRTIRSDYVKMEKLLSDSSDQNMQKQIMLDFLSTFTPTNVLKGDEHAFNRWMDISSVRERARIILHSRERIIQNTIRLIPGVIKEIEKPESGESILSIWNSHRLDPLLDSEFNETPRWQNQQSILDCIFNCIQSLSKEHLIQFVQPIWIGRVRELVLLTTVSAWIQLSAFRILNCLEPGKSKETILNRIKNATEISDDLFARAGMIKHFLLESTPQETISLVHDVIQIPDPSEHVRMSAIECISRIDPIQTETLVWSILESDRCSTKIKSITLLAFGAALLARSSSAETVQLTMETIKKLRQFVINVSDSVLLRALLHVVRDLGLAEGRQRATASMTRIGYSLLSICDHLINDSKTRDSIRRHASGIREELLLIGNPISRRLVELLSDNMKSINEGDTLEVEASDIPDEMILGRALSLLSQKGFGYSVVKRSNYYLITKGDLYQRRIWRILHEVTHPNPAKRQGFLHSVGRSPQGLIRAPSHLLSEMTETKVPGERLFLNSEASWRPYIPTVDDILSLCSASVEGKEIRIFSSEGITSISAPDTASKRLKLWLAITLNYKKLSYLRNMDAGQLDLNMKPSFIQTIASDYDLHISFVSHCYEFDGKEYFINDHVVNRHMKFSNDVSGLRGKK